MTRFLLVILAGCNIDAVAWAELAGEASGAAIFQQAGTFDQISFEVAVAAPADGAYDVYLADGDCGRLSKRFDNAGTIEIVAGLGALRSVTSGWDIASGSSADIVGRALVVALPSQAVACGEIYNSDQERR